MTDQEENSKEEEIKETVLEDIFSTEDIEEKEDLTTLFAVRTTINQESNILKQIFVEIIIAIHCKI